MASSPISNYPAEKRPGVLGSIKSHAVTLLGLLALMWAAEILDHLLPLDLDRHGIRPRTVPGLLGIVAAPFLHGDFAHLIANSIPFVILGGIVMLGGRGVFWSVTTFVVIVGGLGVWLFAQRFSNHIGASGLVFGYLGFLLCRGFFEKSFGWTLVSFVILILYGGLILGVLPGQPGVSWQGHLFGFGAGALAAWLMFRVTGIFTSPGSHGRRRTNTDSEMESQTLEFESPHFLQSLFANDQGLLKQLEESFDVKITTRDGWLKFDGPAGGIAQARAVFEQLEKARRKGGEISRDAFRFAVESVAEDDAGESLDEIVEMRLLGTATRPAVTPRNRNQYHYLQALRKFHVVFGIGPAGTGKTYLAMAHALHQLKNREIDRIILTRPAVEAGETLGFLPGALEEKVLPYLRPLYDALYEMIETDEAQKFIDRNLIEIAPLAYMRGRTLNRACVILDEAQNTSRQQMLMFLTRLGTESSCIVTGDPSQIDLRPAGKSGLLEAMRILRDIEDIHFLEFERRDVVRHPVVQRIIQAYDQGRDEDRDGNRES